MIRARSCRFLLLLLFVTSSIPIPAVENRRLPYDEGIAGLQQMLRKLRTTARLLHITAHPDDEDGAMLALVARGWGATTMLLTLTRGEGGQNRTGNELLDALGLVRTLELITSDAYYGVEQRFTRVADFGFSKSADETFRKWGGRDAVLADMVRVIRTFRPDVITARWYGSPRDGHGNHQAAGVLARDAFRAAADPRQYPELARQGVQPAQPKKLYRGNLGPDDTPTVRLLTTLYDPALGTSYAQLAAEGLRQQLSQGAGSTLASLGARSSAYQLVESLVTTPASSGGSESSFFDGIDTTLPGLASRLGEEEKKVPFLRPALIELDRKILDAVAGLAPENPSLIAASLLSAASLVGELVERIEESALSPTAKADLLVHLRTKKEQCDEAARLALGVTLEAVAEPPGGMAEGTSGAARLSAPDPVVFPGQSVTLSTTFHNRSPLTITLESIELETPSGWSVTPAAAEGKTLRPMERIAAQFRVTVPPDAGYTRPYWHRGDPQRDTVHTLNDPRWATLPLPPYPVRARAVYSVGGLRGELRALAEMKQTDPLYGEEYRPLLVGPLLSVAVDPPVRLLIAGQSTPTEVAVSVRSILPESTQATVRLTVPTGWRVEPTVQPVSFARAGEVATATFRVMPNAPREGTYEITAQVEHRGKTYSEGYTLIGRRDIGWFPFYRPAVQRVSVVAVKLPRRLTVGYVMGAGDDIPDILRQIGITVEMITPTDLARGNLRRFDTIVLGIRAYDVRQDVREHNRRLLDYVASGGTLLVQYNQNVSVFNAGNYTPYPARVGNLRVSVEEAPVRILAPEDPLFRQPNEITQQDFDGWIQERGLYFMESWDERFIPLIESHDPGERPLQGGLLRARYGRGTYLFTAYAFFRQLPAGVPGAVRLFVNLIASGRS